MSALDRAAATFQEADTTAATLIEALVALRERGWNIEGRPPGWPEVGTLRVVNAHLRHALALYGVRL